MNTANAVTVLRMLLSALLYPLAYTGERITFLFVFTLAGITDLLDGYLARKYHQVSELGARLDTYADQFLLVSCIFYVYYLAPELVFYSIAPYVVALWIVLNNIVCWYRHQRLANFHLWSAKLGTAGLLIAVFLSIAFGLNAYVYWVANFLIGVAALETSLVVLFVKKPKTNMGSVVKHLTR